MPKCQRISMINLNKYNFVIEGGDKEIVCIDFVVRARVRVGVGDV